MQHVSSMHSGLTHVDVPLIHAGIDPPVRNPMQSFVNELQLKSGRGQHTYAYRRWGSPYLADDTDPHHFNALTRSLSERRLTLSAV